MNRFVPGLLPSPKTVGGHDAHPGGTQFSAWPDANLTLLLLLAVARTATWNARARLSIERRDINYCSESEQSIII
jgi:hypothetical protein